ncbi:MAG: hypothetical protein K6G42_06500 [Lachnospiraceae bacterium]|nr:hypothetical protein [Lachnospiraceae bacterium]
MFGGGAGDTKAALTIRLLIGAYLLYIDYQIFNDVMAREGISKIVMILFMVLFAVTGVMLIVVNGKKLLYGGGDRERDRQGSDDGYREVGEITERGSEDTDGSAVYGEDPGRKSEEYGAKPEEYGAKPEEYGGYGEEPGRDDRE